MTEPEPPRNVSLILLSAFLALLAGAGAVVVVALLAADVLK